VVRAPVRSYRVSTISAPPTKLSYHIEEAKSLETELEVVESMQFNRGYVSPYFVTNAEKMRVEMEDPYILTPPPGSMKRNGRPYETPAWSHQLGPFSSDLTMLGTTGVGKRCRFGTENRTITV
jgi:hypothetical protein